MTSRPASACLTRLAAMKAEAAGLGFYESPWRKHPRIQLRTVRELLEGKGIHYPPVTGANVTHRRAQKAKPIESETMPLPMAAEDPEPYRS